MNDSDALKIVRERTKNSANIVLTPHAKLRCKQRKITLLQIIKCLERGIVSEPVHINAHGNWQLNLSCRAAGEDITCSVAIDTTRLLIIITTF
jgi:hypothetical protein